MKIVHNDIKPGNIMFSQSYMKNVFIDFGISDILCQNYGEKTLTFFKGTFTFCSDEMKNIFEKSRLSMIDLYKNDVIMLEKTLQLLKSQDKSV